MSIRLCVASLLLTAGLCLGTPVKSKEQHVRDEQSRWDPFHNECEINEDERQQCGRKTFNELECVSRGCCWEPCEGCDATIAWCFAAKRMLRDVCVVDYERKDDCGYYGITEGECTINRGCCWRPSPLPNDPPCFYPAGLRLVNGPTEAEGRVEVLHDGEWGTVCDDMFGQQESDVICRSLGYEYSAPHGNAHYGAGSGQIWLDSLECTGDETSLTDCAHGGWGRHDCGHSEDAGVECSHESLTDTSTYNTYDTYDTYDSYTYYDTYYDDDSSRSGGNSKSGFNGKPDKRQISQKASMLHKKRTMKTPTHVRSMPKLKAKRAESNLKAMKVHKAHKAHKA